MIPSIQTLFDANALSRCVAAQFAIGPVTKAQLWRSFLNDVYRLEVGETYFWLRIHPVEWRSRAETNAEVTALLAIAAAGGSIAKPVPTHDGGYIMEIDAPEGVRTAVLFEDARGSELSYFGAEGAANARRYGEVVAKLHDACELVLDLPGRELIDLAYTVVKPSASLAQHVNEVDRTDFFRISERLITILDGYQGLTQGFCHGDLNSGNIHFKDYSAITIDFDCCGWGWRAFELAAFGRGVSWFSGPTEDVDVLIRAYVEGYSKWRPIDEQDLEVLPAMLLASRIWVTALHLDGADRWGASNYGKPYISRFMNWLRQWEKRLEVNAWRNWAPSASE